MDALFLEDPSGLPANFLDDGRFFFDLGEDFIFEETESVEELTDINEIKGAAIMGFSIPYSEKNLLVLEGFRDPNVQSFDYRPIKVVAISGDRVLRQNLLVVKDFSDSEASFEVELLDEKTVWVQAAKELYLCDLDLGTFIYTESNILNIWPNQSWTGGGDDFYLPVAHYGRFYSGTNQTQPEDYRPWFFASAILKKGFKELGWRLEGPWVTSPRLLKIWTYLLANKFEYPGQGDSMKIEVEKTGPQGFPSFKTPFDGNVNTLSHIDIFFDQENLDPLDRHQLLDNDNQIPEQTSYFTHFENIETTYEARFQGDVAGDSSSRVKFDINVFLRNSNESIATIRDIVVPVGATRTIDVSTTFRLKPGSDIYFTVSAIRDLDNDDLSVFFITAGFKLTLRPIDKRIYRDEEIPMAKLIHPDYTFLEFLKGIMHTGDFKVETDYLDKVIRILPPVQGKYFEGVKEDLDGFLLPHSDSKQLPGELVEHSYGGTLPERRENRFVRIRFAESKDKYIEANDMEADGPLYSQVVDLGDGEKNEIEDDENPFFEPTADIVFNRVRMPALWDNDEGRISWDIGPRIIIPNGYTRQYDAPDTDNFVTLTFNFLIGDNIPTGSQNFTGYLELGSGPEVPPDAIVYKDPDRDWSFFDFWKWSIRELLYSPICTIETFATKEEYNEISFRERIVVPNNEIPLVGRVLEKSNYLVGDRSRVLVTIKPEPTDVTLELE